MLETEIHKIRFKKYTSEVSTTQSNIFCSSYKATNSYSFEPLRVNEGDDYKCI